MKPTHLPLFALFFSLPLLLTHCTEAPPAAVSAAFTADHQLIMEGESVAYTDASTGDVNAWEWTFTGGSPERSELPSLSVRYASAGVYDVRLRVTGSENSDVESKESFVRVGCTGLYCSDSFEVSVINNIIYGKDSLQNLLNLYQPSGDTRQARPVIILLGGGAFKGSNLDLLDDLARNLCSRGVLVATARYRNGTDPEANMIRGQQDARAAVRYFKANADVWRVDTNRILCGGNGTGAFLAYFMAYVDYDELDANGKQTINALGGLEGDQGQPGYSSDVAGVIALAGGMYGDIHFIDSNDPPVYIIHGTSDGEVPFTSQAIGNITLYGATPIYERALEVGLRAKLYPIQGGDHSAPRRLSDNYVEELMWFVREILN